MKLEKMSFNITVNIWNVNSEKNMEFYMDKGISREKERCYRQWNNSQSSNFRDWSKCGKIAWSGKKWSLTDSSEYRTEHEYKDD